MKSFLWRIFQNSGLIIISLGLLYGGVAIVRSEIPFWSLFYGLPAIFLGIIMSLVSFNEIAKNRTAKATEYHQIACRVCGKMTLAPMLVESIVCPDCQYKMAVRLQMGVLVFLALLAIPVTFHLTQQAQNLEKRAKTIEPSPVCEVGDWNPKECQCGIWDSERECGERERARLCGGVEFCCSKEDKEWSCRILE